MIERVLQLAAHAHVLGALLGLAGAQSHALEVVPLFASVAANHRAVVGQAAQAVGLVHLHNIVGVLGQVHADALRLLDQVRQQLCRGLAGVETGLVEADLPSLGLLELGPQVRRDSVALLHVDYLLARLTEFCT